MSGVSKRMDVSRLEVRVQGHWLASLVEHTFAIGCSGAWTPPWGTLWATAQELLPTRVNVPSGADAVAGEVLQDVSAARWQKQGGHGAAGLQVRVRACLYLLAAPPLLLASKVCPWPLICMAGRYGNCEMIRGCFRRKGLLPFNTSSPSRSHSMFVPHLLAKTLALPLHSLPRRHLGTQQVCVSKSIGSYTLAPSEGCPWYI